MGLLDNILGALQGQTESSISDLVSQHLPDLLGQHGIDGLQGLTTQLSQSGLGEAVSSWIGNGENQAVTADQISQALGSPMVTSLAEKFGVDPAQASQFLADHLPQIISTFHGNQTA
ncbi:YidB family protein [Labrys neptuniae]|uniref:YidB family protein n=1 Tax=Labrys neptuniae TaxID=376174 RepID=UPI00289059D3|nr:YidB family protein [Labrys neptuniae]MDT3379737.1 YidB family protein [Labrys neptuniae]